MQNGLVPYPPTVQQLRIRRKILATEVSPEECGTPAPHLAPQPGALVPGRGVPTIASCKNQ